MKYIFIFAILFSSLSWANLHLAPPSFPFALRENGKAVFVDFLSAYYELDINSRKGTVSVRSKIVFNMPEKGYPIFDLIPKPSDVKINGFKSSAIEVNAPANETRFRILMDQLGKGVHTLEMENLIQDNVSFSFLGRPRIAFWIRDLADRMFLEQYVPSNLEFDQYPISLTLNFIGGLTPKQEIHANGKITKISSRKYRIDYPEWYTVSCPYFHTLPKNSKAITKFNQTSIDGRKIPVTIYTYYPWDLSFFKKKFVKIFKELEKDWGPWPHEGFIAYGGGLGGMEHSGATMASLRSLDHEMLHSYFAKGVIPANGNAGWIDEAIAAWRDQGYFRAVTPGNPANMSKRSIYKRNTDRRAYKSGARFMAHLDFLMQDFGGLKAFLRGYFQTYKHTLITTEHFKNNLEFFSGFDLDRLFKDVVGTDSLELDGESYENDFHKEMTPAQLRKYL